MFQTDPERRDRRREDRPHAHARAGGGLVDPSAVFSSIWRLKALIAILTVLGALCGVAIALSIPHIYFAEARLYVDPRDMRASDTDNESQLLPTDAMLAMVDSQVEILQSAKVLNAVVDDLDLTADPEFNGSLAPEGVIGLVAGLFGSGGEDDTGGTRRLVLSNLREAIMVGRDASTFVVNVGVETRNAEKSARIADAIVENYLDNEATVRSGLLERTSSAFSARIDDLRGDLDRAERAVEEFKAENGIIGASGELIGENQLLAYAEKLTEAQTARLEAQSRVASIGQLDVDDVVGGAIPEAVASNTMAALRGDYSQLRAEIGSLTTQLGPRHPRLLSLQSSLEAVRQSIRDEIRRFNATAQTELNRATRTEEELAEQLSALKSQQIATNVDSVELRELEREAAATRQIYEDFLLRARRAGEQQNITIANVRVISEAVAPLQPAGSSRKLVAVAFTLLGFLAGLAIAFVDGAVTSITGKPATAWMRRERLVSAKPAATPAEAAVEPARAAVQPPATDPVARPTVPVAANSQPLPAEPADAGRAAPDASDEAREEEMELLRARMRRLRERADAYARMAR